MSNADNDGRRMTVAKVKELRDRGVRLNGDAVAMLVDDENLPEVCRCLSERCECGARKEA